MTTPTEQVFLFGRIVDPEPHTGISATMLADLTAESAIIIGTMTLLAFTLGFWNAFTSLLNPVLLSVVHILQVLLAFLKTLLTTSSSHEARSICTFLSNTRGGRLLRCIWRWYWPDNKPIHTVCRLLPTLVLCYAIYESSLRPIYWYLCGFLDGLIIPDTVQSVYCMDAITRLHHNHRMSTRKWMQSQYCIGQEDGLNIRSTYDGYLWYNDIVHTEVDSCRLLAYLGIILCIVIDIGLAACVVPKTAVCQRLAGLWTPQNAQCNRDGSVRGPDTQREVELWNAVYMYEAQAATLKLLILTKNEELHEANQRIQKAHWEIKQLSLETTPTPRSPTPPAEAEATVIIQLRQEIAKKDIQLQEMRAHMMSKSTRLSSKERAMTQLITRLQKEAAEKEKLISQAQKRLESNDDTRKALTDRVSCLEQQLADGKKHETALKAELETCRMEVKAQKSHITEITQHVADAEAQIKRQQRETIPLRELPNNTSIPTSSTTDGKDLVERHQALISQHKGLSKQHDDLITRLQQLSFQNRNLAAENEEVTRERDQLRTTGGQAAEQLRTMLATMVQERDTAVEQAVFMQQEMHRIQAEAETELQQLKQALDITQESEAELRNAKEGLKTAYDNALNQQRAETEQQLQTLRTEVNDLQTRMGLAVRDAHRSHEQASEATQTNAILQHRLSKWEKSDSLQEIPKRSTGNPGSVATALAQTKVTVCQQAAEIQRLQQAIRALRGAGSPMDSGWQEKYQAMRQALETEQRAHKEAVVHWDKRNKDLAEELQKVRVSLSNARAVPVGGSPLRSPKRT